MGDRAKKIAAVVGTGTILATAVALAPNAKQDDLTLSQIERRVERLQAEAVKREGRPVEVNVRNVKPADESLRVRDLTTEKIPDNVKIKPYVTPSDQWGYVIMEFATTTIDRVDVPIMRAKATGPEAESRTHDWVDIRPDGSF